VLVDHDPRVLAPRPWTLLQSRWAADLAASTPPGRLLELCAGAGHIGLAAAVLADRDLLQVEADPVAAGYARANAARAGWADRTEIRVDRLQTALAPAERFGLMLADPPYLPTAAVARWPEDPVTAIDGGPDGLDLVGACLVVAAAHLRPGGRMLLQVAGPSQADEVARRLAAAPDGLLAAGERRVVDDQRAVLLVTRH